MVVQTRKRRQAPAKSAGAVKDKSRAPANRLADLRARTPQQKRGIERVNKLLDAADDLLASHDIADFGLYDIAKSAGVPPASVYHFFPTKEAALVALAERYLERLSELNKVEPVDARQLRNWPDLLSFEIARAMRFYNRHPVLMKLFLSGAVTADIRKRDVEYVQKISEFGYEWFDRYFVMPYLNDAPTRFSIVWAIVDGISTASYSRHGKITDAYVHEMCAAAVAYCRTFLPDVLVLRPPAKT